MVGLTLPLQRPTCAQGKQQACKPGSRMDLWALLMPCRLWLCNKKLFSKTSIETEIQHKKPF